MRTFTIDEQNNITAFATKDEAAGASTTALVFSSQKELAKLAADWPVSRFIEIWNGFAGVAPFGDLKPLKKFTDRKVAVARIWQAIQRLNADGAASGVADTQAQPETAAVKVPEAVTEIASEQAGEVPLVVATENEPKTPESTHQTSVPEAAVAAEVATGAPQVPGVAPEVAAATTNASAIENAPSPATKSPKRKRAAKAEKKAAAPRETSKTAQVLAMLQRPEGATITEIMSKMGWLKHTVRGFMAGAMKKAGHNVESFKSDKGERTYRINSK